MDRTKFLFKFIKKNGFSFIKVMVSLGLISSMSLLYFSSYLDVEKHEKKNRSIVSMIQIELSLLRAIENRNNYTATVIAGLNSGSKASLNSNFVLFDDSTGCGPTPSASCARIAVLGRQDIFLRINPNSGLLENCTPWGINCPFKTEFDILLNTVSGPSSRIWLAAYRITTSPPANEGFSPAPLGYQYPHATFSYATDTAAQNVAGPDGRNAYQFYRIQLPIYYYIGGGTPTTSTCGANELFAYGIEQSTGNLLCTRKSATNACLTTDRIPKSINITDVPTPREVQLVCSAPLREACCPAGYSLQTINGANLDPAAPAASSPGTCVYPSVDTMQWSINNRASFVAGLTTVNYVIATAVCPVNYRINITAWNYILPASSGTGVCTYTCCATNGQTCTQTENATPGTSSVVYNPLVNVNGAGNPLVPIGGLPFIVNDNRLIVQAQRINGTCGAFWQAQVYIQGNCVLNVPSTQPATRCP